MRRVLALLVLAAATGCNAAIIAGVVVAATSGSSSPGGRVSTPSISAVTPARGTHSGGTVVTVVGGEFSSAATVSIGGAPAQVTVLDAQTIAVTTPPHATGPAAVVVANPDGGTATLAGGFTFTNEPPGASLATIPSPQGGNIIIGFTLVDPEADDANVALEIDTGSGFQPIAPRFIVSGETTELETSGSGVFHSATLDTGSAFPGQSLANVRLRLTPSEAGEGLVGQAVVSNPFEIDNTTDFAVSIVQPGNEAFHVGITYSVPVSDAGALTVTGLTWIDVKTGRSGPMTVASGQGVGAVANVARTLLTVWDAFADLGYGNDRLVAVSVSISNGQTTRTATSAPFLVSDGPLSDPRAIGTLGVCLGMAAGNVTGGGHADLVVGSGLQGVQVIPNAGSGFGAAVLLPAPVIPIQGPPFPGTSGFLTATPTLGACAILDTNGDGALDAVFPDAPSAPVTAANLATFLANADQDAGQRYVHVVAHQAALRCLQVRGGLDVSNGVWEPVAASIASPAPQVFSSGATAFPPTVTHDATLDNVGWFNQAIVAADLDGPGTPGHGSSDLVFLQAVAQLGRAMSGDTRGAVIIRQVDPGTGSLDPPFYLDPTDMGSLPQACAVGDLMSSTRTQAPFTSSPYGATAPAGSADVIVANTGDGTVTFYLQVAAAVWTTGYTPPTFTSVKLDVASVAPGIGPGDLTGVAIGDLDGDGANDFVLVASAARTLLVFRHDADPTASGSILPLTRGLLPFRLAATIALGFPGAGQPVLADLTGTGRTSIAIPSSIAPLFVVLVNDSVPGVIHFVPVPYSLGASPSSGLVTADANGDGRTDVVAGMILGVVACYQMAEGTLDRHFIAVPTGLAPGLLATGDVLGRGTPQVICPNAGDDTLWVLAPDPATTLSRVAGYDLSLAGTTAPFAPLQALLADATGDGVPDVVVVYQTAVSNGATTGAFGIVKGPLGASGSVASVVTTTPNATSFRIAVGDLNEDGIPDVVVSSQVAGVTILQGLGGGSFSVTRTITGGFFNGVAIADLDGDGHLDVIVASNGTIGAYWNMGRGVFPATPAIISATDDATNMAVADLDGNGLLDVVATNQQDGLGWIVFQTAPRVFTDVALAVGGQPGQVAVGDLDGRGLPDIAIPWGGQSEVAVYYQNSSRTGLADTFLPPVTYPTLGSPYGCAILDVNGDGRNDLVVSSQTTNTLDVFIQR